MRESKEEQEAEGRFNDCYFFYMHKKLGEKLGFKQHEDWYRITSKDLLDNQGSRILKRYR